MDSDGQWWTVMGSDGQLLLVMSSVIDSDGECECNMSCVFVEFDPALTSISRGMDRCYCSVDFHYSL